MQTPEIKSGIRNIRQADKEQICPNDWERIVTFMSGRPSTMAYVCQGACGLIGWILVSFEDNGIHLEYVHVDEQYRGKGYGALLVSHIVGLLGKRHEITACLHERAGDAFVRSIGMKAFFYQREMGVWHYRWTKRS